MRHIKFNIIPLAFFILTILFCCTVTADDNLSLQAEVKAVYTDSSNITAILFEYTGIDQLSITINGTKFDVADEADSNGYIYMYFNGGDLPVSEEYAYISFSDGTQTTDTQSIALTPIVEGEIDDWSVSDDGHSLWFYMGTDTDVVVPNFYNGEIITDIGGYNSGNEYLNIISQNTNIDSITSLTVSDGILNLGHYMCCNISELTGVTLPSTLETIGGLAFYYTSLTGDIVLPDNTKEIYAAAFYNTSIDSITFNDSLERICSYAFAYCDNMAGSLNFPDSLYYIGENSFIYCSNITGDITIPGSVTEIGDGAFWACSGIDGTLTLNEGVEKIGTLAFANDSNGMKISSVSLPSTLKTIGAYAFQYCTKIQTIELNEGLEVICDGAFNHMTGITDSVFTIPSTVNTIGGDYGVDENTGYSAHVFYDMGQTDIFTQFQVAEGNKYFTTVDGVLYDINVTRMIGYPRGKTDTEFEIPEGVVQLDELSFSRASYLKKIILPDSYIINTDMPDNVLNPQLNGLSAAIYANTGVSEIAVKDSNSNYKTIDGILYSYDGTVLYYIPNKYSGCVNIPDGTEKIEKGCICAYSKANTNWNSIYIPATVEDIDEDVLEFINEYFADVCTLADSLYYTQDSSGIITASAYITGDVNADEVSDSKDCSLILKYVSGTLPEDAVFNKKAADVNGDGNINILDAILILQA